MVVMSMKRRNGEEQAEDKTGYEGRVYLKDDQYTCWKDRS